MNLTASVLAMSRVIEPRLTTEKMTGGATPLEVLFVALVAAPRESIIPTASILSIISILDERALARDHLPVLVTTPL
jgi:hypothetical protein